MERRRRSININTVIDNRGPEIGLPQGILTGTAQTIATVEDDDLHTRPLARDLVRHVAIACLLIIVTVDAHALHLHGEMIGTRRTAEEIMMTVATDEGHDLHLHHPENVTLVVPLALKLQMRGPHMGEPTDGPLRLLHAPRLHLVAAMMIATTLPVARHHLRGDTTPTRELDHPHLRPRLKMTLPPVPPDSRQ